MIYLNAAGERVLKYEDDNADGLANWRKRYVYDAETGARLYEERDRDADGWIDQRWTYTHTDGLVSRAVQTVPGEGRCNSSW